MILLDTSVLSAVLRRRKRGPDEEALVARVTALLEADDPVAVPGIVFQEVLSGIGDPKQADRVVTAMRESFPLLLATEGDHLKAADLVTLGARNGLALSTPDALISAQAFNRRAHLFTTDGDFRRLAALGGVRVY